jgi:gliding motility-associated-like protein
VPTIVVTKTVEVNFVFNAQVLSDTLVCKTPSQVQLQATGGDFYSWQPANLFSINNISNPIVTIDTSTTFTVTIGRVNAMGDSCFKTLSTRVLADSFQNQNLYITSTFDTLTIGDSITLMSSITNENYTYQWTINGVVQNTSKPVWKGVFKEVTKAVLKIKNENDCILEAEKRIEILTYECKHPYVFIPNTFTPNNDFVNDFVEVQGKFIDSMYLKIVDRWGNVVFECNSQNQKWDGKYKGKDAQQGAYAFELYVNCKNGEVYRKSGNITLLR